jgi:acetolactate synthase-1/2/3 large subunit
MGTSMKGYDYIANVINDHKITHVFYVEAMLRYVNRKLDETGVKCVMAHSENAAAYMADGYARASQKAGICFCQSIGSANLAGGIHEAWLANSPVVALTGKKPPVSQYTGSYQEADHRLLFEAITKFNADVSDPEQLPLVFRQCLRTAVTGKPRPTHADIANHMGRTVELGEVSQPYFSDTTYSVYPPHRPLADQTLVDSAVIEINMSERPVIVAGRGVAISDAGQELYKMAVKGSIPVVTTPDAKAAIDETDPLWSGIVGAYGMDCANKTVLDADLVIFIGTQTGDQTTCDWNVPGRATRVIQIDIDPTELGKNYPNTLGLLGDAKKVIVQLTEKMDEVKREDWRSKVSRYVQSTLDEYKVLQESDAMPMRPERLCEEISKAMPDDAVVVSDTGFSAVWSATMLRMKHTQKYYRAAGSLGWSFPGALGVKCALPEKPVICFTGDGAFYYHSNELATAVRYGINTVTIINNNSALAQCATDIHFVFKDPDRAESKYCYGEINFSEISKQYGAWAVRITDPSEIGAAIKEALSVNKPAVIEVITEGSANVPKALK